jgi:hypothetical protein
VIQHPAHCVDDVLHDAAPAAPRDGAHADQTHALRNAESFGANDAGNMSAMA